MSRKIISVILSFCFLFTQTGFAQTAVAELNLSGYFARMASSMDVDKFRPIHLRYFSYDSLNNSFKVLLDKGTDPKQTESKLKEETKELLKYFLIGVTLPNDKFWVNLRPDSPSQIIDFNLEETDIGKIMLEADLQLKKDTAAFTSPQTPEGKEYWMRLYKKAEEIYGTENITIPTLTRPWIVPNEIIVRETKDSAYIYKATLKVMLEQDYLKDSATYSFKDTRSKALNEYSSQLIRELIIPKLTKEVNLSKRYAPLRQVYYSLILSRWFKLRFNGKPGTYPALIDKQNLSNLTSKEDWSKTTYFNQYKKSFSDGEYNVKEPVYTPTGQVIRSYFSGGIQINPPNIIPSGYTGSSPVFDRIITTTLTPVLGHSLGALEIDDKISASPVKAVAASAVVTANMPYDQAYSLILDALKDSKLDDSSLIKEAHDYIAAKELGIALLNFVKKLLISALELHNEFIMQESEYSQAHAIYGFVHFLNADIIGISKSASNNVVVEYYNKKGKSVTRMLNDTLCEYLANGIIKAAKKNYSSTVSRATASKGASSAVEIDQETTTKLRDAGLTAALIETGTKRLAQNLGIKARIVMLPGNPDVVSHTYTFNRYDANPFAQRTVNILYGKQRDERGEYQFDKRGQITVTFHDKGANLQDVVVYDAYIAAHRREGAKGQTPVGQIMQALTGTAVRAQEITSENQLGKKLTTVLTSDDPRLTQDGKGKKGYGVRKGAAIDGSHALEGNQGYFAPGGKEKFLRDVETYRRFFARRKERFGGKPLSVLRKPGIGGQHTPFEAKSAAFRAIEKGPVSIKGEYELGTDYDASLRAELNAIKALWTQLAIKPSSKSGLTDETMLIFVSMFAVFLKYISPEVVSDLDGKAFADAVLYTMHAVNFTDGKERPVEELFKDFSLERVIETCRDSGITVTESQVKEIFGIVLGNMVFETTDLPEKSRLSAFIRNSRLDKILDERDIPGFISMFDNVGGRWTDMLHMMTFLAYYNLDAERYWQYRYEGVQGVRKGIHLANILGNKILDEEIKEICLLVPEHLFWFGKAIEQNFNESIWQKGAPTLIAKTTSHWQAQSQRYANDRHKLVINLSDLFLNKSSFNELNINTPSLESLTPQLLADTFAQLFTTFYGMTRTVGMRLISRALIEAGYSIDDVDLNNLDNPATEIVQQNLYTRQPFVELGKGFLETGLQDIQAKGTVDAALEEVKEKARERDVQTNISELSKALNGQDLLNMIKQAKDLAEAEGRIFIAVLYLEGEKFSHLRDELYKAGVPWVMQGTADQHISMQQVLTLSENFFPFFISFIPEETLPGIPAGGFFKPHLHMVSPHYVRDAFAQATYNGLTKSPETHDNSRSIFMRMIDSPTNLKEVEMAFKRVYGAASSAVALAERTDSYMYENEPVIPEGSQFPRLVRNHYEDEFLVWALKKDNLGDVITVKLDSNTAAAVKFGTSGDRGTLDDPDRNKRFSVQRVLRVTQGISDYYNNQKLKGEVTIGYDTRALSREYAYLTAAVLAGNGIKVRLTESATPVPVVAFGVAISQETDKPNAGGIIVTASHNPWEYNGIKWVIANGGAAPANVTNLIQSAAKEADTAKLIPIAKAVKTGLVKMVDLKQAYIDYILSRLPEDAKKKLREWGSNPHNEVRINPMQGSGIGYLWTLLASKLDFTNVQETNIQIDRMFGQVNNVPNPDYAPDFDLDIFQAFRSGKNAVELFQDADADRFGVRDVTGERFTANELIPLLKALLREKGYKGAIAKTLVTSNFANVVDEADGEATLETDTGFRNLVGPLESGKYLVVGEESAHVGIKLFKESKDDGIAVGLMALWIIAEKGSISGYKKEIESKIGTHTKYKRIDTLYSEKLGLEKKGKEMVNLINLPEANRIVQENNGRFAFDYAGNEEKFSNLEIISNKIQGVAENNGGIARVFICYDSAAQKSSGYKIVFGNGNVASIRVSGTGEPTIRLYIEVVSKCNLITWDDVNVQSVDKLKTFAEETREAIGIEKVTKSIGRAIIYESDTGFTLNATVHGDEILTSIPTSRHSLARMMQETLSELRLKFTDDVHFKFKMVKGHQVYYDVVTASSALISDDDGNVIATTEVPSALAGGQAQGVSPKVVSVPTPEEELLKLKSPADRQKFRRLELEGKISYRAPTELRPAGSFIISLGSKIETESTDIRDAFQAAQQASSAVRINPDIWKDMWGSLDQAEVYRRIKRIEEVMSNCDAKIRQEVGDKYFNPENPQYARTSTSGGLQVLQHLSDLGLMGPEQTFGDIGAGIGGIGAGAQAIFGSRVILIEPEEYLMKKGQEAINELDKEGIVDKSKIEWINKKWENAQDRLPELDAAYLYSPRKRFGEKVIEGFSVRMHMRKDAYLYDVDKPYPDELSGSGWGSPSLQGLKKRTGLKDKTISAEPLWESKLATIQEKAKKAIEGTDQAMRQGKDEFSGISLSISFSNEGEIGGRIKALRDHLIGEMRRVSLVFLFEGYPQQVIDDSLNQLREVKDEATILLIDYQYVHGGPAVDKGENLNTLYSPDVTKKNDGSSPVGGIDFKNKTMSSATTYETFGSFAGLDFSLPKLSSQALLSFNLDKEQSDISRAIDNGIIVSGQRIKEFMAASSVKGELEQRRETVITWLAKLGILEETTCCTQESSKEYREALVIADSVVI